MRIRTLIALIATTCASAGCAFAEEDHSFHGAEAGQAAFAAVREIVQQLEADKHTDWSRINIQRLRDHLVDMDEVFMRAEAIVANTQAGIQMTIAGEGRTLAAIKRMVPAHAAMLNGPDGWRSKSTALDDRVIWTVEADSEEARQKLRGLGFFGLLTLGNHHVPHHLAMARGEALHH